MTETDLLAPRAPACTEEVCVTCSDALLAVTVVTVGEDGSTARCRSHGAAGDVNVELIDDPIPGDVLLVQAGVALQRAAAEAVDA